MDSRTVDRLDSWKATGIISDEQHRLLGALVRRERFSVFVELSALLYLGVLSIIGGLSWTFRDYINNLGDAAILGILLLLMAASFGYCFVRAVPYSNHEVESPTFAFDYVLYFACLVFSSTLAFIETRFGVFRGSNVHLLLAALVFGALAYRFDNRFVLSLALSTLAAYLGLTLSLFDDASSDRLRIMAMLYGAFLLALGWVLYRAQIKRHFFDVYLQLGANAVLAAAAFGAVEGQFQNLYLLLLLTLAGGSIALGIQHRRFAFVAYGTVYAYFGITVRALNEMRSPTAGLLYLVVTGSLVLVTLVVVARKFARDEA